MRGAPIWVFFLVALCTPLGGQGTDGVRNSVGMEFVRIDPGTMTVGRFQPPYPKPGIVSNPGGGLYAEMVAAGDANGDLRLTGDEMRGLAGIWFDRVDTQKAGRLSLEQFTQGFAAMTPQARGGFGPPGRGGVGGATPPGIFRLADRNGDAMVSREELTATFGDWFTAWDTKHTGSISSNQVLRGLDGVLAPVAPPQGPGRGTPLTPEEYARIEADAKRDSSPGFQVAISRPYYIGKYEVTQGQWKRVMGTNPSVYQGTPEPNDTDDFPVENVTWQDTQEFIRRLNALEKTKVYRLPTEFEWEYAARAGAEDDITWADIRQVAFIGGNLHPQAVGKMKPNAWGLYDTLGNVWEWVHDYYNEKMFADPVPPKTGREHVLKGGGFIADVKNATYMTHAGGPGSKFDNGFRLARDIQ